MLTLFKRGSTYWVRFTYQKQQHRLSLKTNDLSLARHTATLIINRVFAGQPPWPVEVDQEPTKPTNVVSAFEMYLETVSGQKTYRTLRTEREAFKSFVLDHMAGKNPVATDLERFKAKRLQEVSSSQVAKLTRTIKAVWSSMVSLGLLESNPFEKVKCPKIVKQEIKFLSVEQREALLQASEEVGKDIHLIIALGSLAGLRSAEIQNARWEWVDLSKKTLTVSNSDSWTTKSKKSRTIPLSDRLIGILAKYHNEQTNPSSFIIFPAKPQPEREGLQRYDCRKALVKSCKLAKIEPVGLHCLRKTFASLLAQSGVSVFKISSWLGHSSVQVTQSHYSALQQGFDSTINQTA